MKRFGKIEKRLKYIEYKCDLILSELAALHRIRHGDEIDNLIVRLHDCARKMRIKSDKERDFMKRRFHINPPRP